MKKKECAFCGKEIIGYGNNPAPFTNKGEVCDECNSRYVIPARLESASVRGVLFEPTIEYVIEVRAGEYVKNSKDDTRNLKEAKIFKTEESAKKYIIRNVTPGAVIKPILNGQLVKETSK